MPETKKLKFKMGSDPEFSFVMQGKRVSAIDLLNKVLMRKKGFSKVGSGFACKGGIFGWDGCKATGELRPEPSNDVEEIVNNFKTMFTLTYEHLKMFDMSVLSIHAPVGGHIHFEVSEEMHNHQTSIEGLHKKIASFFLPILISENKMNLRVRAQGGGYGSLNDYHGDNSFSKPLGGYDYTYEFRTPSAEWLTTEKICRSTFAYLATVYNEILYHPENFKKYMNVVFKSKEQALALHKLAITEYMGVTKSLFDEIKKAVRTFELYADYKEQIEYIFNPAKVVKDKKAAEYNINVGWGLKRLTKTKNPSLKTIINEKKYKEAANKKDLDLISDAMSIEYNDDFNVESIVSAFKKRAAAFEWKLKNKYFIFGLKKGIKKPIIFNQDIEIISGSEEVKTKEDARALRELIGRIYMKFGDNKTKTINPITMKLEKNVKILIGLPYDMRVTPDSRTLIKLIYPLENSVIQATKINEIETNRKDLIDDTNLPPKEKGELYKYVFEKENNNQNEKVPYDESSQGKRIAEQNISMIIDEEEQANTDEVN